MSIFAYYDMRSLDWLCIIIQCTMYNIQCTLYIVYCTLYNIHCAYKVYDVQLEDKNVYFMQK